MTDDRPRAAPSHFPYKSHRTMREVQQDEREAAQAFQDRQASHYPPGVIKQLGRRW